jgi:hypothetical protein
MPLAVFPKEEVYDNVYNNVSPVHVFVKEIKMKKGFTKDMNRFRNSNTIQAKQQQQQQQDCYDDCYDVAILCDDYTRFTGFFLFAKLLKLQQLRSIVMTMETLRRINDG